MIVYRFHDIFDIESGPYQSLGYDIVHGEPWDEETGLLVHPIEEKIKERVRRLCWDYYCGFVSTSQIKRWFHQDHIKTMYDNDVCLSLFDISGKNVVVSESQCCFEFQHVKRRIASLSFRETMRLL